jgi:DNA (cytosine-5)-methyltransferase 1
MLSESDPQRLFDWTSANGVCTAERTHCPEIHGDDVNFLRSTQPTSAPTASSELRYIVDLFCGAGGLSLGFHEAAKQQGYELETAVAADNNPIFLACYQKNFRPLETIAEGLDRILRSDIQGRLTSGEKRLREVSPSVELVVGGPPCQGHSDLNNSTRRNDPKNSLYFLMARAARVWEPNTLVIENVPAVVHDKAGVVARTRDALELLGYRTHETVFDLLSLGVPQTRKRHVLVATRHDCIAALERIADFRSVPRTLRWAIGDLVGQTTPQRLIDSVATPNAETRRRIDFLFENDLFDLPNEQRPPCHRLKPHSYRSIYGRLDWTQPAQTITRGFYCMCMGRYVHPSERRTLTAHEAARIQFFPDWYSFEAVRNRTSLATMIGNAVPSKLGYVLGLATMDKRHHIVQAE